MTPEQERILDLIINAENATPDLLQTIKSTTPRSKLKTIPKTLNSIGNMPKEDFLKLVFFRPPVQVNPDGTRRNGMRLSHLGQSFLSNIAISYKLDILKPFTAYELMLIDRHHESLPWYYDEMAYPSYMSASAKMQTLISYDKMFSLNMKLSDNNLDFVLQK